MCTFLRAIKHTDFDMSLWHVPQLANNLLQEMNANMRERFWVQRVPLPKFQVVPIWTSHDNTLICFIILINVIKLKTWKHENTKNICNRGCLMDWWMTHVKKAGTPGWLLRHSKSKLVTSPPNRWRSDDLGVAPNKGGNGNVSTKKKATGTTKTDGLVTPIVAKPMA